MDERDKEAVQYLKDNHQSKVGEARQILGFISYQRRAKPIYDMLKHDDQAQTPKKGNKGKGNKG